MPSLLNRHFGFCEVIIWLLSGGFIPSIPERFFPLFRKKQTVQRIGSAAP
jgi:hypothetical protein